MPFRVGNWRSAEYGIRAASPCPACLCGLHNWQPFQRRPLVRAIWCHPSNAGHHVRCLSASHCLSLQPIGQRVVSGFPCQETQGELAPDAAAPAGAEVPRGDGESRPQQFPWHLPLDVLHSQIAALRHGGARA